MTSLEIDEGYMRTLERQLESTRSQLEVAREALEKMDKTGLFHLHDVASQALAKMKEMEDLK